MAENGEAPLETIDYTALMREAVLGIVRQVLGRVAASGLPGEHHFYLTFGTNEPGVELSPRLRRQFEDEMTIVLQHQFWGLSVDADGFSVSLRFSGSPERIVVPWPALRSFVDPSAGFGLRLRATEADETRQPDARAPSEPAAPAAGAAAASGEKIVDFHSFRRKGSGPADD